MAKPRVALTLMDVPIYDVTMEETLDWVSQWVGEGTPHQIATINPEFLVRARTDPDFRATLNRAALCIPDGIGLLWAARMRGKRLRERVAGSDLVPTLAEAAATRGWRVYFLGAAPGVAETTAGILANRHPDLQVAGCYAGSPNPEEEADITSRIRDSHADIVLVAYGAPKQDLWLARNLIKTGAAVGVGVGGSFDFIAGVTQRAPEWVRRLGLEWLHRLIMEPWRWRRQMALPHFVWLVLLRRDTPRYVALGE